MSNARIVNSRTAPMRATVQSQTFDSSSATTISGTWK